jgi:ATP-binding protein involved in chromosome partitioning
MEGIGKVVAVASGKGGVGKSTISANLAVALAHSGSAVGLLDADMYGPDIPLMFGLTRHQAARHVTVWNNPAVASAPKRTPVERYGVKLMSVQFLVGESQAITWQSGLVGLLLQQFFHRVEWGALDFLIVDLPPGTADSQQLVSAMGLAGAIVVVTPQDVAHLDAKKVLTMFEQAAVPVLGAVENMSWMQCPDCGHRLALFPEVRAERSIWSLGVPRLVAMPFSPRIAADGMPVVARDPKSAESELFSQLAAEVVVILGRLGLNPN